MYWDDRKIHDAIWIEYYVQGTWTYHYPKFPEHKHIYLTSSYSFMKEQSYLNIPHSYYLPFMYKNYKIYLVSQNERT